MFSPEPRTVVRLVLLLAGAAISSLLLVNTRTTEDNESTPELSLAYYLNKAELISTGPDGKMLYQVWTEQASQSLGDKSINLENVRLVYVPPAGLAWELAADKGNIPEDASTIELRGQVIAISGDKEADTTTIRTNALSVNPTTRQATTRQKVVIEYNGRELHATGMEADFEANRLNLLSNVNGKFEP